MTEELFVELFTGLLREMIRIRRFEEKCAELYSATKIRGFLHLCIGEEAVAVGVVGALAEADAIVSTYREHGHALARGVPMDSVMAEMFGRATGCSGGRGGSMHLFDASRRFYGGNAIVAGGLPVAIGLALADHLTADPAVTVCLFGDGAFAEGEFHESANLAALWHLPVLFCCRSAASATRRPRSTRSTGSTPCTSSHAHSSARLDDRSSRSGPGPGQGGSGASCSALTTAPAAVQAAGPAVERSPSRPRGVPRSAASASTDGWCHSTSGVGTGAVLVASASNAVRAGSASTLRNISPTRSVVRSWCPTTTSTSSTPVSLAHEAERLPPVCRGAAGGASSSAEPGRARLSGATPGPGGAAARAPRAGGCRPR